MHDHESAILGCFRNTGIISSCNPYESVKHETRFLQLQSDSNTSVPKIPNFESKAVLAEDLAQLQQPNIVHLGKLMSISGLHYTEGYDSWIGGMDFG